LGLLGHHRCLGRRGREEDRVLSNNKIEETPGYLPPFFSPPFCCYPRLLFPRCSSTVKTPNGGKTEKRKKKKIEEKDIREICFS